MSKNIKSAYINNKFRIFASNWNDEFDIPDGSYSISKIQQIILNVLLKRMKLQQIIYPYKFTSTKLRSTEKVSDKDENWENVPKLEIVDVMLMHCNVDSNSHQEASKVYSRLYPRNKLGN